MSMEVVPRDGDKVGAFSDVNETIVIVEAKVALGPELAVVDPDVGTEGGRDAIIVDLLG